MLGSIIGDIVGSVYEFANIKTKEFPLFNDRGSYTDDSILSVATADWLLHGGDIANFTATMRHAIRFPWAATEVVSSYGWCARSARTITGLTIHAATAAPCV